MSNSAIRTVQVGTQTGVTDTPGTFVFLDPVGEPVYPSLNQGKVHKQQYQRDGEVAAAAQGEETGSFSFETYTRGKGSGAGNAASSVGGENDALLDAYMGRAGQHGVGITSGSAHTTTKINISDTSNFYDGSSSQLASALMVLTSSGVYEARFVSSLVANTSITPHLAFSNAPADSAVVYAGTVWAPDFTNNDHSHLYFKIEGDSWRRDLIGCALQLSLVIPAKGHPRWQWSVSANHWSDTAEENPTFSAGTDVDPIYTSKSPFYVDTTKTELLDAQIDFGWLHASRDATEGTNGQNGWIYEPDQEGPKFSGRIYHDDTLFGEFNTAGTTHDLTLQIGNDPGNAGLVRIPNFDCRSISQSKNKGADIMSIEGRCTRPSTGPSILFALFAS